MKRFYNTLTFMLVVMAFAVADTLNAANSKITVANVSTTVNLTDDVDYIVTGASPFTSNGEVNIVNTDHAVLILSKLKPSKVLSSYMKYIKINGSAASDGVNCQVKMYGRGTIVFPYSKDIMPLTCYTEQNYGGESCNKYTEGHSGGFMKTLSASLLNNKIRSFKLKRGYMVTFAIGQGGWGYSRCFIADQADLEVSKLSTILDGRISSYRLFKWHNAHKAGLASDGRVEANNAVNSSWCYDWAGGNESTMPDTEWVPNHIYEDWPSASSCGSRTMSCHMKTNNEPGNSADDHPQTVDEVLANWQNLMRTGMRLCSESSHDGSMGHLADFIDSIDARGWRCDILDLHCYWNSGSFNSLTWYSDNYGKGRPIWISEWVWGSSWGNNGIFGSVSDRSSFSQSNQQTCYNGTKPILDVLNSNSRVERYAYWNSEAVCSKIYYNGQLSVLGQYYSTMDVGLGYNPANEYIPKDTRLEELGTLTATYNRFNKRTALTWSDPNGDLMSTITVQCQFPGSALWKEVGTVVAKDKTSASGVTYTYSHDLEDVGVYKYRIQAKSYNNKTFYTNDVSVNVDPSQGTSEFQFGKLSLESSIAESDQITYYSETFSESPKVFIGTQTYVNTQYKAGGFLSKTPANSFTYRLMPWSTNKGIITSNEEVPFMALKAGSHDFGLQCEVGSTSSNKSSDNTFYSDTTVVVFENPFKEGVVPVVLAQVRNPILKNSVYGVRIFDVTNTGFKYIVYAEAATNATLSLSKTVDYFAIEPGVGTIDAENEIYVAAGHGTDNQIYGLALRQNSFKVEKTDPDSGESLFTQIYLYKPIVFTCLQTNNYPSLCQLRRNDIQSDGEELEGTQSYVTGTFLIRNLEHTITVDGVEIPQNSTSQQYSQYRDNMGWVAITTDVLGVEPSVPTSINELKSDDAQKFDIQLEGRRIVADGSSRIDVYSLSGMKVNVNEELNPGVYVVRSGNKSVKVLIK